MGAGILPTTIHNNKLYFLFGKENQYEDSAAGFSDFGGGTDNNEDFLETAIREGGEELTGFLGSDNDVKSMLKKYGTYNIDLDNKTISFKTLKNEGTRTINSFTKNGNTVSVTYTDIYLNNKNGDKLEITLVINKKIGKVVLTYFDPLYQYTFAQDFTKNKIKTNK